jgi:hypothetical protein
MSSRRVPILMGLLLAAGAGAAQAAAPARPPRLTALLPAKNKVPGCAKLFVPPEDFEDPCAGTVKGNPQSSTEPHYVACRASLLVGLSKAEGVKAEQASEAAAVTYEAGAEMSVLAVAFADEQAATAVSAGLEQTSGVKPPSGPARALVFRSGSAVAFASCDAEFDAACCRQMLAAVAATWKKP